MTVLIKIAQFLVSLSILVIVHEFGHFFFAKLFKTRVERFYIFFHPGFSIARCKRINGSLEWSFFSKNYPEHWDQYPETTMWGLGWLPLGGYCTISGMVDETTSSEDLDSTVHTWEYRSKNAVQRLFMMIGGVLFNFILALIVYVGILFHWGETFLPNDNVLYGIETDDVGHALGLQNGDKVVSLDGVPVETFTSIVSDIVLNDRQTIQVERDGSVLDIPITRSYIAEALKGRGAIDARVPFQPFVVSGFSAESQAQIAGVNVGDKLIAVDNIEFDFYDQFRTYLANNKGKNVILTIERDNERLYIPTTLSSDGMLGVSTDRNYAQYFNLETKKYGFVASIPAGITMGLQTSADYVKQFRLLFTKDTKAYESLGGFISIGNIFPGTWNWQSFWSMTAFLSIILAIMNILPIPALDGGYVLFLLVEIITRKKPSDKFMDNAIRLGWAFLIALLIFANGNDIVRLFK